MRDDVKERRWEEVASPKGREERGERCEDRRSTSRGGVAERDEGRGKREGR